MQRSEITRNRKWPFEVCKEIAAKYSNPSDMRREEPQAFSSAERFGWLDELFPGRKKYVRVNHLSFEDVQLIVANNGCKTREELKRVDASVHLFAKKRGWLIPLFGEHKRACAARTREECLVESKKYKTLYEFQKNSPGAYHRARRKGWLDDICSHMPKGDYKQKCVYRAIDYKTKSIYIGITCNFDWRWNKDNKSAQNRPDVLALIELGALEQLTGMMHFEAAAKIEKSLIKLYKDLGWNVLNMTNGGEVGLPRIKRWTRESCEAEARKYRGKTEFLKSCKSAYRFAVDTGILNELFPGPRASPRILSKHAKFQLSLFDNVL